MGPAEGRHTDLLVIGAGPYAYSAAAYAGERGIETTVVGRPMEFWRAQMPAGMYLRSGPDWHLDAAGEHTFAAFLEDCGLEPAARDPIPIGLFLDHTEWFAVHKGLQPEQRRVTALSGIEGAFVADLDDGTTIRADRVLAAPGVGYFAQLPDWHAAVPRERRSHSSELVAFDDLAGARVVVVGGRQSAYEWAALLCDHGAARVDVVHRHDVPRFASADWSFVDEYVEQSLAQRGWWRRLDLAQQARIGRQFWEVGRLTLEPWLLPRLDRSVVHPHPCTSVTEVADGGDGTVTLTLSDGTAVEADHVVFATGYRCDIARVPYLAGLLDRVQVFDGYPELSEGFETSLPGLYVTGFAATRDFGPFYGFTKGCPSAARIVVEEMLS